MTKNLCAGPLLGRFFAGVIAFLSTMGAACAQGAMPPAVALPAHAAALQLNSGDTAWMLMSTALVLLMTIPGLALFYAGMVRKKNILATAAQSFAITAVITVVWVDPRLLARLHQWRAEPKP